MVILPNRMLHVGGLAVRLPGARHSSEFWAVLRDGACPVSDTVPAGRWHSELFLTPDRAAKGGAYTFAGGYLPDVHGFDATAFGISPREAAQMDPQQRLLLEVVWEALEDAGIPPSSLAGRQVGVFVGASSTDHADTPLLDFGAIGPHFMVGNSLSILANRVSYAFDLRGPSVTIDTACSSSLVALAQAAAALDRGDVELALVCGVNVLLSPAPFVGFSRAGMLSPTGRCRPFSAAADGYVRAEGAVALVLGAGGPARALIRAVGVNSDGRTPGIALPSAEGQRNLLRDVYGRAGIAPDDLAFIEAHGTGTLAGDPVEAQALGEALGRARHRPLPIGSVKSNIGHLECASGLAGFAKCLLALEHRALPATLHLEQLNPAIDFAGYNLAPTTQMVTLPASGALIAGLCNFGFGGTNAHVVIEAADPPCPVAVPEPGYLIVSAHTREALADLCAAHAPLAEEMAPGRIAAAAAAARDLLRHRLVVDLAETPDVAACLRGEPGAAGLFQQSEAATARARLAFVFTGNGCQHAGMGLVAWERSRAFRESVEATAALIRSSGGICPVETLLAADAERRLAGTSAAQTALYAVQLGIVDALAAQGIRPDLVLGHSVGEIAATAAAGILDRTEAARLIVVRSALQEHLRGRGGMAVLGCDAAHAQHLVEATESAAAEGRLPRRPEERVEIAATNGPSSTTISGPARAVRAVVEAARRKRIAAVTLDVDYPFHHALLEPTRRAILDALADLEPRAGDVPFISTTTGAAQDGCGVDAAYWWANIRRPVLFADAVEAALDRAELFLEIGPRPLLGQPIADVAHHAGRRVQVMASLTAQPDATGQDPLRALAVRAIARGAVPRGWGVEPVGPDARRLPLMRWNRKPFRLQPTQEASGLYGDFHDMHPAHPLAGVRVMPGGGEWRQVLSLERVPFLSGHRVDGQAVFPATGFIEIMTEVGGRALGSTRLRLRDFDILLAMVLEPGVERELSILWDEAERSVAIRSRRRFVEGERFVLHARGTIDLIKDATPAPAELPHLPDAIAAEEVYEAAERCRIDYCGPFRAVASLRRGPGAVLAELRRQPLDLGAFQAAMLIDPAAFDAAFHGLFLDVAAELNARAGELPVRVGRLSLFAPGAPFDRALARVVRRTSTTRIVDIDLLGPGGELVARAEGVVMRRVVFAAWRDDDRIVLLDQEDPAKRDARLLKGLLATAAFKVVPAEGAAARAMQVWAAAIAAELAGEAPAREALPLWHAMRELMAERPDDAPASADAAIAAMARDCPDAVMDLRAVALASEILPRFLRSGRHEALPAGFAEAWLAASALTAPVLDAIAATILDAALARGGGPLRVALLEPGLAGLLPRLLPALREELILVEVLTADPGRVGALLARHGAQRAVAVRDATRTPGTSPDLVAAVVTVPLDSAPPDALVQVNAPELERALLLFGVPPHAAAIDMLHGAEEGWWDQSPGPEAPVGLWPLPAETLRALDLVGRGEALRNGLDPTGAGLLLFDRGTAPPPAALNDLPPILVRPAALSRAQELLPGVALRPYATGEEAEPPRQGLPGPVLIDLEVGPAGSERAALRQRILRLRDAAADLGRIPGARLYVLCEGEGATAEAARALARTIANEYQSVTVSALVVAGEAPRPALVAALRQHLASGSPERELVVSAEGVTLPRLRRGRAAPRLAGPDERTVLRLGAAGLGSSCWDVAPRRAPGPGEVEVEVAATGLNFRDVMLGLGLLDEEILGEGLTGGSLGFEFSGRVVRVGAGRRMPWRVGDAVMGFSADAFASHLVVSAAQLLPVPAGLALEAAAALPVAGTTAWHALVERGQLRRGETVLLHGGAGAVGLAALGIARARGARAIAAASTPEKRAMLRRFGAHAVVDSRAPDIEAELRRVTDGIDVVLNSMAGDAMRETLRVLKPFGRFVEIGKRDFLENTRIGLRPFRHNIAYIGVDIDQLLVHAPRQALRAGRGFLRAIEAGRILPIPAQVLPGARIADAFRLMQVSGHIGKIVIRPEARGQDRSRDALRFGAAPGLHVVLGGTRGFGLAIAFWLTERGAAEVLVASRGGRPDAADQARIDALAAAGRCIRAEALDVADAAAVRAAFARWRARHGRIAGVVHAAMVLSDGLLAGVTPEQLDAVLAPKVDGIRAAAAAIRPDELQYFLACSSSAVVVGSPGQGAYVAANGFVEGAVRELRGRGVPALAVAWGVIEDVGIVARSRDLADRLRGSAGIHGISSREALQHLDRLLADPAGSAVVSGYAVLRPTAGAQRLATLRSPLFADVLGEPGSEEEAGEALDLAGLSPEEAEEQLLEVVRAEIGQVLRLPITDVDADRPLIDLGLDSLMALELRLGLEKRTGIELSVLSTVGAAQTARRLVGSLLPALRRDAATATAEPAALPPPEPVAEAPATWSAGRRLIP